MQALRAATADSACIIRIHYSHGFVNSPQGGMAEILTDGKKKIAYPEKIFLHNWYFTLDIT
ncbi:MAG: hypothetical protein EGR45_02645 [Ruminococcaceae bacterium]|nr:hypothetical protein [Oscillospiraceae bacterium]